jgi:hypothetical protein
MRTLEEIDAKFEEIHIQAESAKRRGTVVIIIVALMALSLLAYLFLVFVPAARVYDEHIREVLTESISASSQDEAADRPNLLPVAVLPVLVLVYFAVIALLPPKRRDANYIRLHRAFTIIRKELDGPGWHDKAQTMLAVEAGKEPLSAIFKKYHVPIVLIPFLALQALLVYAIVKVLRLFGSKPVLAFLLASNVVLSMITLVFGLVVLTFIAKLKTKQETKVEVLRWIVSEADKISPD